MKGVIIQGGNGLYNIMNYIQTEASYDAAHFLTNYDGKCRNIHGHRFRVKIEIKGELTNGMLVDFTELKKDLKNLVDYFDHTFIVEENSIKPLLLKMLKEDFLIREVPFRTTAENFSKYFYDKLKEKYNVSFVEVYETPTNCARYQ